MKLRLPRLPQKATAWAILAGVSYVLCFPRFDLPALSLLFMPGLLFCLHALGERRRQAFGLGLLLSAMVAVGGFHWIVYVAQSFGEMPMPAALALLVGFCLIAAPQMVAFLLFGQWLRFPVERLPLTLRPLFWAALYVALEYLAHFFKIFPENLGNTLIAFRPLAQAASLGGAPLLTFLPLFLGAALYYLRRHGRRAAPVALAALALPLGLHFWGQRELAALEKVPTETIRVGFVQHNLDEAEKQFAKTSAREVVGIVVDKLLAESGKLAATSPKPDLILWPETAYPMVFPTSSGGLGGGFASGYANLVKEKVGEAGVPVLFGGYLNENGKDYNAGILLGSDGHYLEAYRKQVLLIFGEYFPFDETFPSLKTLNPMMGDFGRGPGPVPLPFAWRGGTLPMGVSICYEAILPEYTRGYVRAGARVLVNLTKDSWFGDTFEPWEHFQLAELRAVEHHVPLLRSTNTGLSGIVYPSGDAKVLSNPFHEAYAVLDVPVPLTVPDTLYTRLGEWFALLCVVGSLLLGAWAKRI